MHELNMDDLTDVDIEGLIHKTVKGDWIAFFDDVERAMRVKVDYCPWCGIALTESHEGHKH